MFKKFLKDKKGSEFINFIVWVPFLLILIVVISQIAIMGYDQVIVQETSLVAAKSAAQNPDTIEVSAQQAADNFAGKFLPDWSDKSTINVSYPDTNPGSEVTVTIHYIFPKYAFYTNILKRPSTDYVRGQSMQIIEEKP